MFSNTGCDKRSEKLPAPNSAATQARSRGLGVPGRVLMRVNAAVKDRVRAPGPPVHHAQKIGHTSTFETFQFEVRGKWPNYSQHKQESHWWLTRPSNAF